MAVLTIQFMETRNRYGSDGGSLALQDYLFRVDGREVVVEVQTSALQTLDKGQLRCEEVQLAVRTLIEIEIEAGNTGLASLVLNEDHMTVVAERLNWRRRFRRDLAPVGGRRG
jgi:hypothetical protein